MGLQDYFLRPDTIDRIRSSWIGSAIEKYVDWLSQHQYSPRNVWRRVPLLMRFGDFARARGATRWSDLPDHVDAFVAQWAADRGHLRQPRRRFEVEARNPVEQMLRLVVPRFENRRSKTRPTPFQKQAPRFFEYLRRERGLSENTIKYVLPPASNVRDLLGQGESHQAAGHLAARPQRVPGRPRSQAGQEGAEGYMRCPPYVSEIRRQRLVRRDLAGAVESPRTYRLAELPRAITWDEVHRLFGAVDRRTALGKRDYAILLFLVTYGLRAREVAALRLENIDWRRGQLRVVGRKAGHSTTYPLARAVGDALVDYLKHGRPKSADRAVFFGRSLLTAL